MKVKVISLFEKETDPNGVYVNTTSRSESSWQRDLSPFYLGPCKLYWDLEALVMENRFTKDGRKIRSMYFDGHWIRGKIGKRNFVWQYTGNYIGSNYPHCLDIDWKRKI